ncbi:MULTISPECIES: CHRD domain-containing protein [Flavobacterium]|uniref:CHRD domain-containing protein n=1 Tax=Flavobacterium TaxID=237 RepID=UPI001FCAA5EF|nr:MULTISPECIES: CHRD domain-containing protein [Flavobacterium]UOK41880.1 CHRD domain-containing protein [Flavobacterium enshiense]
MSLLVVALFTLGMVSCSDDNDDYMAPTPSNTITFKATLNGLNEVPPNASTATGNATLTFNNTTKIFTIKVTHNVETPTNGHIHLGDVGVSGLPVFPFPSSTSPINFTSRALTAEEEADLKAELYYVNIHNEAPYEGGEIRGQLLKQATGY